MKQIKIGLIGFGQTGKAVARTLVNNEYFKLSWIFKRSRLIKSDTTLNNQELNQIVIFTEEDISIQELLILHRVDYIVDFSSPDAIYSYGTVAAANRISIISAISHYTEQQQAHLKKISEDTVVFWSANITLGVNFLMMSAKLLKQISPGIDIQIIEEHFKDKKEVSGTALKIAGALDINPEDIHSIRAGGIVGRHQVIFGFPYQTVRIIHEAIGREAFGNGIAFIVSELDKERHKTQRGFYTFEQILQRYIHLD